SDPRSGSELSPPVLRPASSGGGSAGAAGGPDVPGGVPGGPIAPWLRPLPSEGSVVRLRLPLSRKRRLGGRLGMTQIEAGYVDFRRDRTWYPGARQRGSGALPPPALHRRPGLTPH